MRMNKNIFTFMSFDNNYDESDIVVFGAPFDGTTSNRPGTRFASMVMRNDSFGLETYSPYLDKDLEDISVFDGGDLELPFGNTKKALDMLFDYGKKVLSNNKKPIMIGGEHLVSLPLVKACKEKYNNLVVFHFDAHADVRDDYLGEKYSHATVMRRISEVIGGNNIYQFGIRSGTKEEFRWAKENTNFYPLKCSDFINNSFIDPDTPVYITIDLDVLDPSIFPGTGTPEPGGIMFYEIIEIIKRFRNYNVIGADIVELAPHYDQSGVSNAVACKILREITLAIS